MRTALALLALAVLAGCKQERIEDVAALRAALAKAHNLHGTVQLTAVTEASGSEFVRFGTLDWHADSLFTLTARDEDGLVSIHHLAGTEVAQISRDSVLTTREVDPAGEVISNYYTGLLLPTMLQDTSWFTSFGADSTLTVFADDAMIRLEIHAVYDLESPDFHPETRLTDAWEFDAVTGLPRTHAYSWYRGDMGYGTDIEVRFDWTEEPASAWAVPDWVRQPEPVEPAAQGDWYEATLAALPDAQAPPLVGHALDGSTPLALSDFAGQILYLDFWYIGCGPCMQALPHLADLQARYADRGFTVLGANSHQDAPTIQRYLKRRGLDVPQLVLDSLPSTDWPVRAYPTWFLIGRDGHILDRGMGFGEGSEAALDSMVQAHL